MDSLGKVDQASIRGDVKNAKRPSNTNTQPLGGKDTPAVIHQHQIRTEGSGQGDCSGFPFVKSGTKEHFRRAHNVEPGRRIGNPAPNRQRSKLVRQFSLNNSGKDNRAA